MIFEAAIALLTALFLGKIYQLLQNFSPDSEFLLITPATLLSEIIPSRVSFNINAKYIWGIKFDVFEQFDSTVIKYHTFMGSTYCMVADAAAAKTVYTSKAFTRPASFEGLTSLGPNIITTDEADWRRYRNHSSRAFSEMNNEVVWKNSERLTKEWLASLEETSKGNGIYLESDTTEMTARLALMIITSAGFGVSHKWTRGSKHGDQVGQLDLPGPGRKLGFLTCLGGVLSGHGTIQLPNWVYKLPFKSPNYTQLCIKELELTLKDMIVSRREEKCSGIEHNDLFSLLLKGDENEKASMTEQEVMGNMYIFLLAGHGTTAHTLAFTFTLLALYPQHQERIYQEALATIGDRDPSYSDYHSLHYTQATFLEALRLFPVLPFFAKIASEDTTLTATTCQSRSQSVSKELTVPKGSVVIIAAQSLHFNPEYYPEPYEFRPSRFLDTEDTKWNRDAFSVFGGGNRPCLGRKFASVEVAAILSTICLNYKIVTPSHLEKEYSLGDGETERQRRDRIFELKDGQVSLTPTSKLPLCFVKRGT